MTAVVNNHSIGLVLWTWLYETLVPKDSHCHSSCGSPNCLVLVSLLTCVIVDRGMVYLKMCVINLS